MDITYYKVQDAPVVATFFRKIFKELGWKERGSDYMDEPHMLFHLPDMGVLLLAKENGKLVGTVGIILLNKEDAFMKRLYVDKTYRGTGLANKLFDETVKKAKSMGIKRIVFDVSKNNSRAIAFYRKNGFSLTTVTPRDDWPESKLPQTHLYFQKLL